MKQKTKRKRKYQKIYKIKELLKKESENDNWSSLNSTANQFEDIEIPDAREEEDEDDEELNRRLYIPPNLIYLYQSMSLNDTKDEFIDSMSDIFTIENIQNNDMN